MPFLVRFVQTMLAWWQKKLWALLVKLLGTRQLSSAMGPRSRQARQRPKCGGYLGLLRRVALALKGRKRTQTSRFSGRPPRVFCAPPMGHLGSSRAARVRQAMTIFKYSYVVRDSGLQIWPI